MNLDSLTHTSGEWLRGGGPESDIVISSRIRLARNLAAFPFTSRASSYQKAEIEALLRERISRELASADGPRGVALLPAETVSVMVNEEDHMRLQVMRSGYALDDAW